MAKNSFQRTTKNGRPITVGGLPLFTSTVDSRIKKIRQELNKGLSKFDSKWENIKMDVSLIK